MAAKKSGGGWGGFAFAAFIGLVAWQPAFIGIAIVIAILWVVFAANAKFSAGNNPGLMQTGQRGHVEVAIATRSQVRSRSGSGPWMHTWTIVLNAQPPQSAGFRTTIYRKIPEREAGPQPGQRWNAWFAKDSPQNFHVDWSGRVAATTPEPAQTTQTQTRTTQTTRRPEPRRTEAPAYQLPEREDAPLPMVEADGGYGFDFTAKGLDGRARIDDYGAVDDGSTELALTVMPRGRPAYRTVVNAYVPGEKRHALARGASLKVRVDPSAPGRLTIVS